MTHVKHSNASPSRAMTVLSRVGRISVFFLTAGFAYPNVFAEGLDPTKIQSAFENTIKAKTIHADTA